MEALAKYSNRGMLEFHNLECCNSFFGSTHSEGRWFSPTMLRQTVRSFGALSLTDTSLPAAQLSRSLSSHSKSDDKGKEDEVGAVRKFMVDLRSKPIPKSVPFFTYSKSSGAGGQHVNT